MAADKKYWVVRAGDDIQDIVEERSVIGIGWQRVGDLGGLAHEDIQRTVQKVFPDENQHRWAKITGQLYRFASEISKGDVVLTPIKATRHVLIEEVAGDYTYDPEPEFERLANTREVNWLRKGVTRDGFSVPMKNSLEGLMTVFKIDGHKAEIDQFIDSGEAQPLVVQIEVDPDIQTDTEDASGVEASARERIRDRLFDYAWNDFEKVVAAVLTAMGFTTRGYGPGKDRGVDLIATRDTLGFGQPRIKVQVKRQANKTNRADVQRLAGILQDKEEGLFVSLGGFTPDALSESRSNLSLLDGEGFIDLLLQHYDNLNPEMRTQIPLKRVYLPLF